MRNALDIDADAGNLPALQIALRGSWYLRPMNRARCISSWVVVIVAGFGLGCSTPAATRQDAEAVPPDGGLADTGPGGDALAGHPPRKASDRSPLTARCDPTDETRCLLPWPSNTFATRDPQTATRLRLALEPDVLGDDDSPAALNRADGFPRVSPVMTAFVGALETPSTLAGAETVVRVVVAQADHPAFGESVPVRLRLEQSEELTLLVAYPLRPMEANADHVVAVLDGLRGDGGAELQRSRHSLLALGRAEPASAAEQQVFAYHAPTRAALQAAKIDPARVLRVWDFTTRSADDATAWVEQMQSNARAAVDSGAVTAVIDAVQIPGDGGPMAAVVEARLLGLPLFIDADGELSLDAQGAPTPVAQATEARFRIVLPAGSGDYGVVLYGHGSGGTFRDAAWDAMLTGVGLAKVGVEFRGWTEDTVLSTLVGMVPLIAGSQQATAPLMQSLADIAAIQRALGGPLGDLLSAPLLQQQANPTAQRRPDPAHVIWAGGSLGGTMGMVHASADPEIKCAVLNVPGAAPSHWLADGLTFSYLTPLLQRRYGSSPDSLHMLGISQLIWDLVDGASWTASAKRKVFLVQESIGDPVLPNPGSEMVAVSAGAVHVGPMIEPILGVETVEQVEGRSGITQYRVADTKPFSIHGFAARDTPAGEAAREQVVAFIESVLAGQPRIVRPSGCKDVTPDGSCDFN